MQQTPDQSAVRVKCAVRRIRTARCPLPTAHCRRAVSLVELLIALAIGSAMLLATAVALDAVVRASAINVDVADGLMKSRLAVTRMLDEIRVGRDHAPVSTNAVNSFRLGSGVTDSGLTFTAADGQTVCYTYNSAAKTLSMQRGTSSAVVLARRVDSFSVQLIPTRSAEAVRVGGTYDLLTRATITLTLRPSEDAQSTTLSASVSPRQQKWD
jgi:hypothetical protein